jgi:D-tagatose-1,6-bisphosphate aldolase subunit GatZ/KbaZ
VKSLQDIVARNTRGEAIGIWSLCSAHPAVIEAAMHEAMAAGTALLVEATSNQVNQFGGYTGMRPADFVRFLRKIATQAGFPPERVWMGGDHLGPNAWRGEPASAAMEKATELVGEYVTAGFRKIHLDCSMSCGGDPPVLPEELVATRGTSLAAAAEGAWKRAGGEAPVYVIGTEVPTPGGATEDLSTLAVTTPQAAAATIEAHRSAFSRAGLESAWPRVVALVVQPGVEFDHHKVVEYRPQAARALSELIGRQSQFVYEAHSTDYQPAEALRALVRDHFAILKVGPGATFALRGRSGGLPRSSRRSMATGMRRTCARPSSR